MGGPKGASPPVCAVSEPILMVSAAHAVEDNINASTRIRTNFFIFILLVAGFE
jgi:hypothetical protein